MRLLSAQLNVHPPLYFVLERYWLRLVGAHWLRCQKDD